MDKGKSKTPKRVNEKIIDLSLYRRNKSEQRRREYERLLFNRILGVYSFAEKGGLHHIEVIDVSQSGLRFREKQGTEKPMLAGQQVNLRLYFTPHTFLRILTTVKRMEKETVNGQTVYEYGCEIDRETLSYETLRQLLMFMEKYAQIATEDPNPPMIWF